MNHQVQASKQIIQQQQQFQNQRIFMQNQRKAKDMLKEMRQSFKDFKKLSQKFDDKPQIYIYEEKQLKNHSIDVTQNDQQVNQQQEQIREVKSNIMKHVSEILLPKLQPLPIFQGKMSLQDDIRLGWKPRHPINNEVPTNFNIEEFELTKKEKQNGHLIYKYPKLKTSKQAIDLHLNIKPFQTKFNYEIKPPQNGAIFSLQALEFSSEFESGNIDKVIRVGDKEYNLYMRADTNTKGCFQWFNFVVKNLCKIKGVKFNIMNFKKRSLLYQSLMKIRISNQREYLLQVQTEEYNKNKHPWIEGGYDIRVTRNDLYKYNNEDSHQYKQEYFKTHNSKYRKAFYTLSFKYDFEHQLNITQFSLGIPYTYSDLQDFLKPIKDQNLNCLKIEKLCTQLSGIKVPILTITDPNIDDVKKKLIIITARCHPGDHQSSYIIEGIINSLIKNESVEEQGIENQVPLLSSFIFKIIPMLNSEGVIIGNNRTSLSGQNLDRCFMEPDQFTHPEMLAFRNIVCEMIDLKKIKPFLYLNLTSSFNKKNFYMNSNYFSLHDKNYLKIRVLPQILHNLSSLENDCQFRYHSCKFKFPKNRNECARVQLFKEFGFLYSYDFVSSLYGFRSNKRSNHAFTINHFIKMGEILIKSISQLTQIEYQVNNSKDGNSAGQFFEQFHQRFLINNPEKQKKTKEIIQEIQQFDQHDDNKNHSITRKKKFISNNFKSSDNVNQIPQEKSYQSQKFKQQQYLSAKQSPLISQKMVHKHFSIPLDYSISIISDKSMQNRNHSQQTFDDIQDEVEQFENGQELDQSYRVDELDGIQLLKLKRILITKGIANCPEKAIVIKFIDNQIVKLRKQYSQIMSSQVSIDMQNSQDCKSSTSKGHYHSHCKLRDDELTEKLSMPAKMSPQIKLVERLQVKLKNQRSNSKVSQDYVSKLDKSIFQSSQTEIKLSPQYLSQSYMQKGSTTFDLKNALIPQVQYMDEEKLSQLNFEIKDENTPTPNLLNPIYEKTPLIINQSSQLSFKNEESQDDKSLIMQQYFEDINQSKHLEFPFKLPLKKNQLLKKSVFESLKLQDTIAKIQTCKFIIKKLILIQLLKSYQFVSINLSQITITKNKKYQFQFLKNPLTNYQNIENMIISKLRSQTPKNLKYLENTINISSIKLNESLESNKIKQVFQQSQQISAFQKLKVNNNLNKVSNMIQDQEFCQQSNSIINNDANQLPQMSQKNLQDNSLTISHQQSKQQLQQNKKDCTQTSITQLISLQESPQTEKIQRISKINKPPLPLSFQQQKIQQSKQQQQQLQQQSKHLQQKPENKFLQLLYKKYQLRSQSFERQKQEEPSIAMFPSISIIAPSSTQNIRIQNSQSKLQFKQNQKFSSPNKAKTNNIYKSNIYNTISKSHSQDQRRKFDSNNDDIISYNQQYRNRYFKKYESQEGILIKQADSTLKIENTDTNIDQLSIEDQNDISQNVLIGNKVKIRMPTSIRDKFRNNQTFIKTNKNIQKHHQSIASQIQQSQQLDIRQIQQTPESLNEEFKSQLEQKLSDLYLSQIESSQYIPYSLTRTPTPLIQQQINIQQQILYNNDVKQQQKQQEQTQYQQDQNAFDEQQFNQLNQDLIITKDNILNIMIDKLEQNQENMKINYSDKKLKIKPKKMGGGTSFQQYLKKKQDTKLLMWYNKQLKFQLPPKKIIL